MTFTQALLEGPYGQLARALIEHFAVYPSAAILERLRRVRVPMTPVNHQLDLFTDAQTVANELVAELTHSEYGQLSLAEYLGYDPDRIATLRAAGVVR